ncbi:TPA: hypothetical protein L5114_001916 [Escherichia coli]|nr:hypothetical protein [Escherichia coli]
MNPLTDYCFKPAQNQARFSLPKYCLHRLIKILTQKGDPTLINCGYHLCNKQFKPERAYTTELVYMHGNIISRKKKKYCSEACAEKDQMAHEL